jgi:phosphatidate cytidylyltransferase
MARPPAPAGSPGKFADLRLRLVSALGAAALALFCVWLGGVWIALLAAAAALVMVLEWRSITAERGGPAGPHGAPYATAAVGGVVLLLAAPVWVAAVSFLALTAAGLALDARRGRAQAGLWSAAGTFYIGGAAMALVALRGFDPFGFLTIVWAVLVVIAADAGGYFAGRLIGGPKLWRRVSPNKTWAGMAGGVALAVLVGGLFSSATTGTYYAQVCTVSAVAALLSQAGDLGESALKRRFGVKDAGTILPGHGGLLDRLDGHIPAILVAAIVTFSRGQAVFVW